MTKTFVFDTNSLISANLLPNSITRKAYDHARLIGALVYSDATLIEFSQTFVRAKFDKYIPFEQRLTVIMAFERAAQHILISQQIEICRDPKDNKFLELAIEANASCIITGDKDLLVLTPFRKIPIVPAAEFLELFQ